MAKYRKKPVIIEAEQWNGGEPIGRMVANVESPSGYSIGSLEGFLHVTAGDFIITGVKGEQYPCKPDIFAATYDAVE